MRLFPPYKYIHIYTKGPGEKKINWWRDPLGESQSAVASHTHLWTTDSQTYRADRFNGR